VIAEVLVGQRQLTGITVRLEEASWYAKYVFPFLDTAWKVRFLLFDVLGDVLRMWQASSALAGKDLRIAAKAADVPRFETVAPEHLRGLLHFDPWWVLKGGARIPEELRSAAVATNIASRYHALDVPRRVKDVVFDTELRSVVAVRTEDESFAETSFQAGELDLARLRPTAS
jgi:hypothetical protein